VELLRAQQVAAIVPAGSGYHDARFTREFNAKLRAYEQAGGRVAVIGRHEMVGDAVVPANGLDVRKGETVDIEVRFGKTGNLDGVVKDPHGSGVAGATVVLMRPGRQPAPSSWTDQVGRFHMDSIPPGDYKMFAWADIEQGLWLDATFMKACADKGVPVTVGEGSSATMDVTVIPEQ